MQGRPGDVERGSTEYPSACLFCFEWLCKGPTHMMWGVPETRLLDYNPNHSFLPSGNPLYPQETVRTRILLGSPVPCCASRPPSPSPAKLLLWLSRVRPGLLLCNSGSLPRTAQASTLGGVTYILPVSWGELWLLSGEPHHSRCCCLQWEH